MNAPDNLIIVPARKLVQRGGVAFPVSGLAFDLLVILAGRAGEIVTTRELMEQLWPGREVSEANLRNNINILRKFFGDVIRNVPARGYVLASGACLADEILQPPMEFAAPGSSAGRIFGREQDLADLCSRLKGSRVVTITGAGGIGKTTLALAVAEAIRPVALTFVELARYSGYEGVVEGLATCLGLTMPCHPEQIAASLKGQGGMLLLDNCEHVIESVACWLRTLRRYCPELTILTTSREPLRVDGEDIFCLGPLGVPESAQAISSEELRSFPAVQLFFDRASVRFGGGGFTDEETVHVAQICRRLDGLPLAIELAAARAEAYDLASLSTLLDDRFSLLTQGRRTALPRHQTLRATLEWSYDLLGTDEQCVFRRLGVFPDGFDAVSARQIALPEPVSSETFTAIMSGLVAKSLVVTKQVDGQEVYRLLESMRAFAMEKLEQASETDAAWQRLAQRLMTILSQRKPESFAPDLPGFVETVRAVLAWAQGRADDEALLVALAYHALPLFLERSRMDECARWARLVLDRLALIEGGPRRAADVQRMLGLAVMMGDGDLLEAQGALEKACQLAERAGDVNLREAAMDALYISRLRTANYPAAMEVARSGEATGHGSRDGWKYGISLHFEGRHGEAVPQLRNALNHLPPGSRREVVSSGIVRRIYARCALARSLWAFGDAQQALAEAEGTIAEAEALEHPISHCVGLLWAAPVLIWGGRTQTASLYVEQLILLGERYAMVPHRAIGQGLRGALRVAGGDVERGLSDLRGSIDHLLQVRHQLSQPYLLGHLVEALTEGGEWAEALRIAEQAIALVQVQTCVVYLPQLLLLKARILARNDANAARLAIDLARREAEAGEAWAYVRQAETAQAALLSGRPIDPVLCGRSEP